MTRNERDVVANRNVEMNSGGNGRSRRVARQLSQIDGGARPFGEPPELREAPCQLFQPRGFDGENLDTLLETRRRVAPQTIDRETDRGQRVLQLVRDLSRRLTQRRQAFRLERCASAALQPGRHLAHPVTQYLELRRARPLGIFGERLRACDALGPPDELANIVERLSILHVAGDVTEDAVRAVLPVERTPTTAPLPDPAALDHSLTDTLDEYERMLIARALSMAGGNVAEAARKLKTDRPNLYRRMRRLGIGNAEE
jgi:hypothetical protein